MKPTNLLRTFAGPALVLAFFAGCSGNDDLDSDDDAADASNPGDDDDAAPPRSDAGRDAGRDAADARADAALEEPDGAADADAEPPNECADAADGTPCGEANPNPCMLSGLCQAGSCEPAFAAPGTACGDATDTDCSAPDSCDGAGACLPNHEDPGTACGDATADACNAPDTCDAEGACLPNFAAAGTACGDANATDCNGPDQCTGDGACGANLTPDGTACYDCAAGAGHCTSCAAVACGVRDTQCAVAASSLVGNMTAGNNHRGNMFTIVATNTVTIESFDASPMGNTTIAVYYRRGPYQGFETNEAGWTLLGSAPVVAQPGTPAPVPVPVNVTIRAGESAAFYVTSTNTGVSLNYSNGSNEANVAVSDGNLAYLEGVGMEYPFTMGTGAVYRPRIWNGVIHYSLPTKWLDATTAAYAGGLSRGLMFDVSASGLAALTGLDLELEAGPHDVSVFFRRGTFVGHEASAAGWEPIGSALGMTSAGGGARSSVRFDDAIQLAQGERVGLYVDIPEADKLRITAGGAVGDVVTTNGALQLEVGTALGGAFEGAGAPAAVRGLVQSPSCQP